MTQQDDSAFAGWLADGPDRGSSEVLETALARVRSTRQRPAWLVGLVGGTIAERPATVPLRYGALAVGAALLAGVLVGALIAGGILPPRPVTPNPVPNTTMALTPSPTRGTSATPSSTWTHVPWQPSMMGGLGPVVWTGSRFVAVAQGSGQLAFVSSADGETWERQSPIFPTAFESPGDVSVNTLAAGPGGVVAGGSVERTPSSASIQSADAMVWYSPDGATWTSVTGPPFNGPSQGGSLSVEAVTPAGNGWVAVGFESGPPCEPEGCVPEIFRSVAWSSRDGLHWTRASTSPVFDKALVYGVAVAGQGFVAVGLAAAETRASTNAGIVLAATRTSSWRPAVWTSTDGLAWSRVPEPATFYGTTAVVAGAAGLVAIGIDREVNGGFAAWWSADGKTWVPSLGDFSPSTLRSVVASPDGYLILGGPVGPGGWPDPNATPLPNACPSFTWSSADGRAFRCVQVAWSGRSFTGQGAAASSSVEIVVGTDSSGGAAWLRRLP